MKPTIYIAGKVTGEPLATVTAKFGAAQVALEKQGYNVINPLAVTAAAFEAPSGSPTGGEKGANDDHWLHMPWTIAMRLTLAAMMTADAVYMLKDWKYSKGATIEHDLALKIKLPITYEEA